MCVTPPKRKANQPAMTKLFSLSLIAAATLSGCAATGPKDPAAKPGVTTLDVRRTAASTKALDEIAASYLRLSLEIGTHEPGYIDAYYGPPQLKKAAEAAPRDKRSEEHTSELQSLMRISYAVFCLKKKKQT